MLPYHAFWCILVCLTYKVNCLRVAFPNADAIFASLPGSGTGTTRFHGRRTNAQDVEPLSQDVQQNQIPTSYDYWEPRQQKQQPSQLNVSNSFRPWEQNQQDDDCILKYDKLSAHDHRPMFVETRKKGFLYPTMQGEERILQISNGETVLAGCPGKGNYFKLNNLKIIYITCNNGQLYNDKQTVFWPQLGCRKKPKPTIKRGKNCGSHSRPGRIYTITWPIRKGSYIPQITLCFNEKNENDIYSYHQIHGKNLDAKFSDSSRPSFKEQNMFHGGTNNLYTKKAEKALFKNLLHSDQHLTGKKQNYLARGHLAPDSDFILEAEQDATYYYANVVPQWQAVNNGNWKSLEFSVRELAENHQTTLDIWTGTYGVLNLPDENDIPVELYLGLTDDEYMIPVPAFLWKVVYEETSNSAVAIVEVNDIRGLGTTDSLNLYEPPCDDLCAELSWVDWDIFDHTSGLTFCCCVSDLQTTIPNLPDLGWVGILKS